MNHDDPKLVRRAEQAKYAAAYRNANYRMGDARRSACRYALSLLRPAGLSLVDVGCGRGEFLEDAKQLGIGLYLGVECTLSLVDLKRHIQYGALPHLPLAPDMWDIVTCFDVLEHLPPFDTELALRELRRVGKKYWLISAADYPHVENGVDYHINARPHAEWEALFQSVWPLVERVTHPYGSTTALWRCEE